MGCSIFGASHFSFYEIPGRDQIPLYQIKIPESWTFTKTKDSLSDTTKPLCTLSKGKTQITIHNFYNDPPIPPEAQIARWEKQLIPNYAQKTPQAFGGFVGLLFEGSNSKDAILGWALTLAPELTPYCSREKQAEVTIKVTGSKNEIEEIHEEIVTIARSFQFLDKLLLEE